MKICLVSAFPPSKRVLNEYGYHIARELQRDPLLSVTILADELEAPEAELPEFEVVRCWSFNSFTNPIKLLRAIRDIRPDVVWFNLVFNSFGNGVNPLAAFLGLMIPALSRFTGSYTHVTLHHLMEHVDLETAGIKRPRLYRAAGQVATRALLMANSISVLLPAYRRTLMEKYGGGTVHFRAHGIFSARPEFPDFALRGNPEHRILAFGKWGTYKRVEPLVEAFSAIADRVPEATLVIAGGNNPNAAGYIEAVSERFKNSPRIRFTGYVPEEKISQLFGSATMLVMPYSSATGSSGVAHQACEYGLPIICGDVPDFREMAADEGLAVDFYDSANTDSLAHKMLSLLRDPVRQREMSEQNFSAALRMTMPQIIRQYLRSFDLRQRAKALEPISRFRRIPSWIPSRSALFRAAAPKWAPWM